MKQLLAQDIRSTFGTIEAPKEIPWRGADGINALLNNIIGLFFTGGAVAFIILFLWGAIQMILSGGDKEAISKARAKITWAIIGITLMSLSYFIFQLLQDITGFKFFI